MVDPCGVVLTGSFAGASGLVVFAGPDSPIGSGCGSGALSAPTCSPPTPTTPGCGCGAGTTVPEREGPNTTCEFGECTRTALAHCVGAGCCAGGTPCTQTRHMPPGGAYLGGDGCAGRVATKRPRRPVAPPARGALDAGLPIGAIRCDPHGGRLPRERGATSQQRAADRHHNNEAGTGMTGCLCRPDSSCAPARVHRSRYPKTGGAVHSTPLEGHTVAPRRAKCHTQPWPTEAI